MDFVQDVEKSIIGHTGAEELEYLVASKFEEQASCVGRSVHVFVDPSQGNKPTPVPEEWKPTLRKIEMSS